MNAQQVIELAEKHVAQAEMRSSAQLCIDDAKACLANGKPEYAKARALRSLFYSVGRFSPVYKEAEQTVAPETMVADMLTEEKAIASARTQYRAMFKSMAASGVAWHLHRGTHNVVLLREDAQMDVPLPVIVPNVHAMAEQTMINALSAAIRRDQ
jgi:hypothetical protein